MLVAALGRDPAALGPIYDRHGGLVFGLALAILRDRQEAEDLTQEVFLSLCRGHAFDPTRGALPAFLTTMTRSRAIDRLRRRTRTVRVLRHESQAAVPPEPEASPLDRVSMKECGERVRRALAELPERERHVLELSYYQGLTQAEIAEDLGAPLGTVKTWCRRGLRNLQRALADLVD